MNDLIFSPERKQTRQFDTPYRSRIMTDQVFADDDLPEEERQAALRRFRGTMERFCPEKSKYRVYFGELHGNSCLSDDGSSPDDCYRNIRDVARKPNKEDDFLKNMIRKTTCIALAVLLTLLVTAGCGGPGGEETTGTAPVSGEATEIATEEAAERLMVGVKEISKHGNVLLDTTFDEMRANGMDVGDIITVSVGDTAYELPIGTSYTDVDSGEMVCRFDREDNVVAVAINMGSFAGETGLGEKQTIEADPGYQWDVKVPEIRLQLKEKQGYLEEYNARNLTRTDAREDYADLSDEEFANFRAVSVTGMKENVLYRSSTPVEPALGRNEYAMAAMEQAGIRTVLNLDDSVEIMEGYETYPGSYYSTCHIVNSEMGYDFGSEEFAGKVKECVLFLIENDGPYLIHCKEGKDRTGILCAVLECFVGASAGDIENDYMITYRNYYGVVPEDTSYGIILKNNLVKTLCGLYQTDSIEAVDLKEEATEYLLSTGLTEEQLDSLGARLAK